MCDKQVKTFKDYKKGPIAVFKNICFGLPELISTVKFHVLRYYFSSGKSINKAYFCSFFAKFEAHETNTI